MLENKGRKRKVLVVDSSSSVRTSVWMILKDEYVVLRAGEPKEALEVVSREEVEVVLVGVDRPLYFYGVFFRDLRRVNWRVPVLLLFGEGAGGERKVELAFSDGLGKPFLVEELREKVRGLLERRDWAEKSGVVGSGLSVEERVKNWFYSWRVTGEVRERVLQVSGLLYPVMIQGEEGTGRSVVAKAVHYLGLWKEGAFLRFDCRGLRPEVFVGRLKEWWQGGGRWGVGGLMLYLEGVESLGWEMQGLVLDLMSEGRVEWPGVGEVGLEVRVISSSGRSLGGEVKAGRFRGDLREGLGVLPVELRSLRERRGEIPRMVGEILEERGCEGVGFSGEAMGLLQEYYWPGNLWELEGVVLRSVVKRGRGLVGSGDLEFSFGVRGSGVEGVRRGEGGGKVEGESGRVGEGEGGGSLRGQGVEGGEKGTVFDATVWTLAHEIKNPLVAISTYASLLPEKYEDEEFRGEFSRLVSMDVKRVNEVLENLLEYAQFGEPREGWQDLKGMVEGLLGQKEKELGERGVQLEVEMGVGLPGVRFDGVQLGYVLRNVLGNACLRVREGSKMRLWAGLVEGEGKGFVELGVWYEEQNGVMRQVRGERVGEGAELENWSLALALARKVMVRNRGEMRVSLEEGVGTTIRLRFPAASGDEK